MAGAYNRKQRRAAAAASNTEESETFDSSSIPLAHAPEHTGEAGSKPEGKTLYEIAAEREAELFPDDSKSGTGRKQETEFVTMSPSGEILKGKEKTKTAETATSTSQQEVSETNDANPEQPNTISAEDYEIPPVADTLLTSIPLSTLHFTLSYLAAYQFAQEIELGKLLWDSAIVCFPLLSFMIHLAHGNIISFTSFEKLLWSKREMPPHPRSIWASISWLTFPPAPRTLFYLPLAAALGLKLMAITNDSGYYAVMKRAPSVGTLWVWCVLEMAPSAALLAFMIPITVGTLFKGYSIF